MFLTVQHIPNGHDGSLFLPYGLYDNEEAARTNCAEATSFYIRLEPGSTFTQFDLLDNPTKVYPNRELLFDALRNLPLNFSE